jgi:chromosome segregation ATPase
MSTQSLLIIGETGANYPIYSLSELKSICENYFNQLGITQNDISIINNLEQNFLYLNNLEYRPNSKYFIFSKRFNNKLLQVFHIYKNKNNDLTHAPGPISINIPDISKFFYILEQNNEYLPCSIDEIKQSYDAMVNYYTKFNNLYKIFKSNINSAEKIKEYFQYQNEAVDLMNNIGSIKFEKCFNKYQDFIKDSDNSKQNNDLILKNYMDNIDRLKKIELPESFKKYISKKKRDNNIKYLIDIYYKENDMNIWRDNCLNKQECLFNKVKTKDKVLQKEKIQINKDTNSLLTPLKNNWNFYISEYEKLYKDRNSYMLSLLNEINNDFTSFNNILSQIKEIFDSKLLNSNPNYINTIKESYSKILAFKEKYSDMNKLSSLSNYLQQFYDYINKMNNSIDNIAKKINEYFMNIRAMKNILEKLTDKIVGYCKGLKNIEEDFKFLETPGHFINSYENTLIELKRRNNFNIEIQEELIKIKALINNENFQRKKFIEENKKYLTPDFTKLFKLENKPIFNYDYQNNNEHIELSILLPEVNNNSNLDRIENNNEILHSNISTNNNFEKTGKFIENNNNFSATNNNKKLYQNLLNQINEIETKLKGKEKELSEAQNKYIKIENNFLEREKDINNLFTSFDEISDSFNKELSFKEKQIEELNKNIENLNQSSTVDDTNVYNNSQTINCPLCKERISNGKDYQNIESVFQDLKQEINKYKKQINELDSNYKKLIANTILIKKTFFNHMNMVIAQINSEMAKFREQQEEKEMHMEEMLSAEKLFNKNSINEQFGKLNNKIKEYKATINNNNEKITNYEKLNNELKSKELFLKRELQISIQKNEKLSDNNIELTNELRQKHKDNTNLAKLLEQIKKEHVESIKMLNSNIDGLNIKLYELREKIKEKENEDSKKYQQYIEMKEQYTNLIQEKEYHIQQIKELSLEIKDKNKKIDELLQIQETINQSLSSKATKCNTNDLTLSMPIDEDIIYYKKIEKGLRCIFVPFSENIFVCINLSQNLEGRDENDMCHQSYYDCKYILDLKSFNQELSKIIIDNSLIVIGKISRLTELEQSKNKFLNLPENKQYTLATLGKVDYVIGFPGNEMVFNNYIN